MFVVNLCYAQYEPFKLQRRDNTAILQQAYEKMDIQQREATEQFSKLQIMLGEYGDQLNNDEATLIWFDNYKMNIKKTFERLFNHSWGEAEDYAIRMQGEIVNDPELKARIRTSKEYQLEVKSIQERKDMSIEEKKEWMRKHPYCFIPILNNEGKIVGGKLGTKAELEAFVAKNKWK